jgi:hypothetical protein
MALGFALVNDRRRLRKAQAELAALHDDEATPMEDLFGPDVAPDVPEPIDRPERSDD